MEIPNPKTAGIGDRPSLLTPVGLRPPSVDKLVSSTITLLLFQSHIIDKPTFLNFQFFRKSEAFSFLVVAVLLSVARINGDFQLLFGWPYCVPMKKEPGR